MMKTWRSYPLYKSDSSSFLTCINGNREEERRKKRRQKAEGELLVETCLPPDVESGEVERGGGEAERGMQGGRWRGGRRRLIVVVTVVCSPLIVPLLFFLFFPLLCFFCVCYFCFRPRLRFHRRRQEAQEPEGEVKVPLAKPVPVAEGRLLQKYLEDQLCLVGELGFLFKFGGDEEESDVGDAEDHPQKQHEQVGNGDFT